MRVTPISIPSNITIDIQNNSICVIKDDIKEVLLIENGVTVKKEKEDIIVGRIETIRENKLKAHSLYRRLSNTIKGLQEKFTTEISVVGTGYFIRLDGAKLELELGYSHRIYIDIPKYIGITINNDKTLISCHNKQILGTFVSKLEALRYPNVYSGKGILITGKNYIRKVRVKKKK